MRGLFAVSFFVLGSSVCSQAVTVSPSERNSPGYTLTCDMSKMGKPNERVDVLVRKDGTIRWNDEAVTKQQFEIYAKDAAKNPQHIYIFIEAEDKRPALRAKVQDLRTDAMTIGVTVPQCSPIRGANGHIL